MKKIDKLMFIDSSSTDEGTLNIEIATSQRESLLQVTIDEKTRELKIYMSSVQAGNVCLDFEALVNALTRIKFDLNSWADRVKDPEE